MSSDYLAEYLKWALGEPLDTSEWHTHAIYPETTRELTQYELEELDRILRETLGGTE